MEEEVPTLTEKPASAEVSEPVKVPKPAVEIPKPEPVPEAPEPAAEVQRPAETGRRQTSGKRDEAVARHGGSAFGADGIEQKKDRRALPFGPSF